MSDNITIVYLLNTPLENDYKHTLYFASASAQASYFSGCLVYSFSNFTYQRKDNIIRVPKHFDELINCNYVMYQNSGYTNKWFYAFITKMEYVSDGRTDIYIETDVIQTWMFDCQVKQSFIEREHVNDDTIGIHTVPESLETGEYIINAKNKNASLNLHTLVIASTLDLNADDYKEADGVAGGMYNGIYSGVRYYKVDNTQANTIIEKLAKAGRSEAIVSIFVVPSLFVDSLIPSGKTYHEVSINTPVQRMDWVNTFGVDDEENFKPKNLNGYKPKNNKLFTFPYCYMLMTNNSGGSAIYHYEYFNNPDDAEHCAFYIYASITPGMSITISPRYYKGVDINSNERLNLGKFPICSWNTDVYTNWLTQNAVNIPLQLGSSVVGLGTNIATGNAFGVFDGVLGIANTLGSIYQHSLIPPQAEGNINSGDVAFSSGILTFTAYQMTIKKEYAQIIDKYFDMFGYKVNMVKTPNKNHRENYWFIKTIDANITGAIPMNDMQKIKECYNKGITFWKHASNIKDYSVSNKIV